jgi:hypothetical protein
VEGPALATGDPPAKSSPIVAQNRLLKSEKFSLGQIEKSNAGSRYRSNKAERLGARNRLQLVLKTATAAWESDFQGRVLAGGNLALHAEKTATAKLRLMYPERSPASSAGPDEGVRAYMILDKMQQPWSRCD